jgi:biopolymer transport protein ExbD
MKNLFVLSLILLSITVGVVAQDQPMQRGISVKMPITTSAGFLPAADNPDAWIVTITSGGDVYFGTDAVTPESLLETMKARPRMRQQELYIKADARAPLSSVQPVLEAAQIDLFRRVYLLAATPGTTPPGEIVHPAGIPLWFEPASRAAVVVRVSDDNGSPDLKINDQEIPLQRLQHTLEELLQNHNGRNERVVVLKADGSVPFGHIVHVVDVCHMVNAVPVVGEPAL